MKICILSNSHGASLKSALDGMTASELGMDITIFAAPKKGMRKFVLDRSGKTLVSTHKELASMVQMTSGGLASVDLTAYDGFLLHGLFVIPPRLDRRHSSGLAKVAIAEMLADATATQLAQSIASATRAPILISPEPLLADQDVDGLRRETNAPSQPAEYADVIAMMKEAFVVPEAHWLPQPGQTIGSNFDTLRAYSTDSARLSETKISHKERDVRHMNADYGRLVLEAAAARFSDLMQPA